MVVITEKWLTRVPMIAIAVLSVLDGCGRTGLLDTSALDEVDAAASEQGPGAASPITSSNGSIPSSAAAFNSGSSSTSGSSSVGGSSSMNGSSSVSGSTSATGSSSMSGSDASVFGSSSATTSASSSSALSNGPPPSCQPGGPGMTNCGPGGIGSESCCTSLPVTGGTYYRTYTNLGSGPTSEADPATVSSFRLDKYLVTVGRFRQYLNYLTSSSGAPPADGSGIHTHLNGGLGLSNSATPGTYETGWDGADFNANIPTGPDAASSPWFESGGPGNTWTTTPGTRESVPINDVNWYEAYAFCIWDGGFLPSDAESEYAAAGGSQQREYPWGSTDPGTMNQYAIYDCYYPGSGECTDSTAQAHVAPVGTAALGAGYWGQFDLAGELWEFTLDEIADYVGPCTDCAYLFPSAGEFAGGAIRGGDFAPGTGLLYPFTRGGGSGPQNGIGFRCARTP
jgi:sulfatase modifying factor 1